MPEKRLSRTLSVTPFVLVRATAWAFRLKHAPKRGPGFPFFIVLLLIPVFCLPLFGQCTIEVQDEQESSSAHRVPRAGFPVSENFQALIDHSAHTWPQVPVHTLRLWDTGTAWFQMNPADGVYDWHVLDSWLNAGEEHKVTLLMTLAMTPVWASSNPTDPFCRYGPGVCDPPNDLSPDGGGTDRHWKDFVTAIAQHVGNRIQFWEIWNEPHQISYFHGNYAQMTRMAHDARTIIQGINPGAKMLNGGVQPYALCGLGLTWWKNYAAAGGLKFADVIALHGDVRNIPNICGDFPKPENFLLAMRHLNTVLAQYGELDKPVWDTEASWGRTDLDCFTDQDLQAAFLARFFLLHLSEGIQRFYWRSWIGDQGGLYEPANGLNLAGVAYVQIHDWFAGATLTQPCSVDGTVWNCDFIKSGNYVARAVWDTSKTCHDGICETTPYPVGPPYVDYRTLDGSKITIDGNTVPIGAKPIWLEN